MELGECKLIREYENYPSSGLGGAVKSTKEYKNYPNSVLGGS